MNHTVDQDSDCVADDGIIIILLLPLFVSHTSNGEMFVRLHLRNEPECALYDDDYVCVCVCLQYKSYARSFTNRTAWIGGSCDAKKYKYIYTKKTRMRIETNSKLVCHNHADITTMTFLFVSCGDPREKIGQRIRALVAVCCCCYGLLVDVVISVRSNPL